MTPGVWHTKTLSITTNTLISSNLVPYLINRWRVVMGSTNKKRESKNKDGAVNLYTWNIAAIYWWVQVLHTHVVVAIKEKWGSRKRLFL